MSITYHYAACNVSSHMQHGTEAYSSMTSRQEGSLLILICDSLYRDEKDQAE